MFFQNNGYQEECKLQGIPEADCNLLRKVLADFKSANYLWILVVLGAYVLSNIIRAIRWRMLIRPMGYNASLINAFLTLMLGYFANLGFPRLGELLRPASLARYENIPMEKLVGTVVSERVIDFICLGIIILLSLVLEFRIISEFIVSNGGFTEKISGILTHPLFWTVIILGFGLLWFISRQDRFKQSRFYLKLKEIIHGFGEGLKTIFKLQNPWLFIGYSLTIWLLYYLMTYLCFSAFLPTAHLGLKAGLVIFTLGTLGIVIPTPGGMGSYHFLLGEGLKVYGLSSGDSFSFANIIFFSIQIFCNIFIGLIAVILLPIINKESSDVRKDGTAGLE